MCLVIEMQRLSMHRVTLSISSVCYGIWHCHIVYPVALGNSGQAEAIISKSMQAAKRTIRREIVERSEPVKVKRLSYKVAANDYCASNHCHGLTIAEA